MRTTHRIIGCALCLAIMGPVAAASLDTLEMDHAAAAASDRLVQDGNSIGGGTIGHAHDSHAAGSSDAATGTSRNGSDHSGAGSSAPAPAPRSHLGWQSLLPGSIQ